VHKRWGWYIVLLKGKNFKVKVLYFNEGGSISMQRHKKREELWLFIFGRGEFRFSDKEIPEVRSNVSWPSSGQFRQVKRTYWHKFTAAKPTLVLEI